MSSVTRFSAAFLLALLLPVQAFAAACAQICAQVEQNRQAATKAAPTSAASEAGRTTDHHCDDSGQGAGKCCNAHAFLIDVAIAVVAAVPAFPEHGAFVARWTNFIPEEPSPPPIATLRSA